VRKKDGSDYEPDSLRVMIASLDRHLKEAGSCISIAKDREFVNSRKVLEGKASFLREQGYGKRTRASKALTTEDEELLWSKGLLGSQSPKSLIATMWFLLTQHFGLRGCQEHHDMYVEDFSFSKDDNGVEYITYEENPTKTRQGGLRKKKKSGSAENVRNWWAKMSSQASKDVPVTQTRGNEKQWAILPHGD